MARKNFFRDARINSKYLITGAILSFDKLGAAMR